MLLQNFFCLFAAAASVQALPGVTEWIQESARSVSAVDVNNATAWATVYAYPLLAFVQIMRPFVVIAGANGLYNEPGLVTAANEVTVRPNVDTLYSGVAIDLSSKNVELTIPDIEDRFYVFPFYDTFGNNFANLGSLNSTKPGKYLLRPAETPEDHGYEAAEAGDEYLGYVNYPTAYGCILIRILLENNGTDVDTVKEYQKEIGLKEVSRVGSTPADGAPSLSDAIFNVISSNDTFIYPGALSPTIRTELLQMLANVVKYTPPESTSYEAAISANLKMAGVSDGSYSPPLHLNSTEINLMVNQTISSLLDAPGTYENYGNGWQTLVQSLSGDFGSHYDARAYIAYLGYLQLDTYVALYPIYNLGSAGSNSVSVSESESLLFTFSGKPPVNGFWSLTAYGSDNFLIDNPYNVYALGDRSNLTYSDGVKVYSTEAAGRDDTFQILVQASDVAPPSNWTSNWLPGPTGGGVFGVNLRYYGPTEEISSAEYVQPVVTKISAIVA